MSDSEYDYHLIKRFVRELKLKGFSYKKIKKYIKIAKEYLKSGKTPKEFLLQCNNKEDFFALKFFIEKILDLSLDDFYLPKKLKKPTILTKDEVEKMLFFTKNETHYAIICALYFAGLRLSEARLLKWRNIDFENDTIYLTKNKRIIFLHPRLKEAIEKIKNNNYYVFVSVKGKIYDERTIQQIVNRAARKARLGKHVTPQTLRRSFATHLLESGADIRYIQNLLGHKDLRTTQMYASICNRNIKSLARLI